MSVVYHSGHSIGGNVGPAARLIKLKVRVWHMRCISRIKNGKRTSGRARNAHKGHLVKQMALLCEDSCFLSQAYSLF